MSEADGDELARQVQAAIAFLEQNRDEINRLWSYVDNEGIVLDFGIWSKEVYGQYINLPPQLLQAAGELEDGIELSVYQR